MERDNKQQPPGTPHLSRGDTCMLAVVAVHVLFLDANSNRIAEGWPTGAGLALIGRSEQCVPAATTREDAGMDAMTPILWVFRSAGRVYRALLRRGAYLREQPTLG